MITALCVAFSLFAQEGREQLVFVNRQIPVNASGVSLLPELALHAGTRVTSLTVAIAPQFPNARNNVLRFWIDGIRQEARLVSGRIEFVQIPIFATVTEGSRWILSADSPSILYGVGATLEGPPLPPPSRGPECNILGYGSYSGYTYNFRVAVGDQVMDASNSLDTALEKVEAIVRSGLCQKPVYPNVCKLKGYGAYQGYSYAYRLSNQKGDLLGTNSFDTLANQLGKLREHGFCSSGSRHQTPDQLERCGLLGSGSYQGYMYRHRITIGNEVVDASNSLEVVTSRVEQLRRLELCQ